MSGGSWDYFYGKLEEVCDCLHASPVPLRRALGAKMRPFVQALHDIEWVDSCDYAKGAEIPAIEAAIGKDAKRVVLEETLADAERVKSALDRAIVEARDAAVDAGSISGVTP